MKRFFIALAACVGFASLASAQNLKFSPEGEFKIVQFTDLHYQWGNSDSDDAPKCIATVLDAEKPDLVVITGDLIYSVDAAKSLPVLLAPIVERNIPFATAFGNHDPEFDMKLSDMYDLIQAMPGNVQPARGEAYSPDYVLTIAAHDSDSPAEALYLFDSHSLYSDRSLSTYEWITYEQIGWYRNTSAELRQANNGNPLPSLAFFHVPVPEFAYAAAEGAVGMVGTRGEAECVPSFNSGLFTSFREMGDVYGIFCGHDHDNDYVMPYKGILLGYGRYSGGNTVYNNIKPNGGRVIVLHEGKPELTTYLRLTDGTTQHNVTFPAAE